jgi:hypothetical protein
MLGIFEMKFGLLCVMMLILQACHPSDQLLGRWTVDHEQRYAQKAFLDLSTQSKTLYQDLSEPAMKDWVIDLKEDGRIEYFFGGEYLVGRYELHQKIGNSFELLCICKKQNMMVSQPFDTLAINWPKELTEADSQTTDDWLIEKKIKIKLQKKNLILQLSSMEIPFQRLP